MPRTPFKRTDRVSSLVRRVLGELIAFEVKDPRAQGVIISDVEITGDLREARVFIAYPGDEHTAQAQLAGLQKASGFMRRALGQRVQLRVTPQLHFRIDRSLEYGNRIEQKLRELGLGAGEPDPGDVGADDAGDDGGGHGPT